MWIIIFIYKNFIILLITYIHQLLRNYFFGIVSIAFAFQDKANVQWIEYLYAGEIKLITNSARKKKKVLSTCRLCENMYCRSSTANCFFLNTHPVVILSGAWNFLRFPSPEGRKHFESECEEESREGGGYRRTAREMREYTRHREHRTRPICFRWVMSRFAYRNCPWRRKRICPKADKVEGMTLGHDVGIKFAASADLIAGLNIVSRITKKMDRVNNSPSFRGERRNRQEELCVGRNILFSHVSILIGAHGSWMKLTEIKLKFNMAGQYSEIDKKLGGKRVNLPNANILLGQFLPR